MYVTITKNVIFFFLFYFKISLFCIGRGESLVLSDARVALWSRGGWLIDVVGHGVVVADLAWLIGLIWHGVVVADRAVHDSPRLEKSPGTQSSSPKIARSKLGFGRMQVVGCKDPRPSVRVAGCLSEKLTNLTHLMSCSSLIGNNEFWPKTSKSKLLSLTI